jgi:hypothetical protein
MANHKLLTKEVIEAMDSYIARIRPPEDIRDQLDVAYKIEDQSIIVFEIRPSIEKPEEKREHPLAKATFVNAKNHWKVFWLRADMKWHSYEPKPAVNTVEEFIHSVEQDKFFCFWG